MFRPITFRPILLSAAIVLAAALPAGAHFVFVVPEPDGTKARVIMSEDLKPDEDVSVASLAPVKLSVRDAGGKETPLATTKGEHALHAEIAGTGLRVVHGEAILGVKQKGEGKPYLLVYYPKSIVGDPFNAGATLGDAVPIEFVPVGGAGALKFRMVAHGKPVADAEVTVIMPDGKESKTKTDAQGETRAYVESGQFGVWGRFFEPETGKQDGKPYEEVRRYPTLVVTIPVK